MPGGLWSIILIPCLSGLIGWGTNLLAITMLFRPRRARRLLFLRVHGLLPRRQPEIAHSIAEIVSGELLSQKDVAAFLKESAASKHLADIILDRLDKRLGEMLGKIVPLFAVLSSDMRGKLREALSEVLEPVLARFLDTAAENFEDLVDFHQIVEDKVNGFDLGTLENLVHRVAHNELRAIEILGGVIGFLIGCVQILVLWLLN